MDVTLPEPTAFDPSALTGFLRRRWVVVAITAAVLMVAAFTTALLWPPTFRSTATILVEEQEIPQDLVRSTVTSYADQRIQVIGQQVMTRANLLQIMDKYALYPSKRATWTNEELLDRMRKDVKMSLTSADVAGGRRVTIAFSLSYDGETPDQAQKVANELVTLYLNENLKIRQQKAEETATFLATEAQRLEQVMVDLEARLATFKQRNMGQLPELSQLNLQLRDKAEAELSDLERAASLLEQRRFLVETQLGQTDRAPPPTPGGADRVATPAERLRALKAQRTALRGAYSGDHPDMVRLEQQMRLLEEEVGTAPGAETTDPANETRRLRERLEADLSALLQRYSDDHPDVKKLRQRIAALPAAASDPVATPDSARPRPDSTGRGDVNPLYLGLQTQIKVIDTEIEAIRRKRSELQERMARYEGRLVRTPQVEQEYLDLTRERENTVVRYREMKQKLMEAQVAQELEKGRKGERFSLIDPPQFPEKPLSPNRPLVLALGVVLALAGGAGTGALREVLDRSIKGPGQLDRVLGAPILAVVPHLETAAERARRVRRRWIVLLAVTLSLCVGLAALHFAYRPLGVLWFMLLRRLDIVL
jgi:uncharacterized protein involved in exopolysaccharide biosynthesis